jgi:hypothetical protein
MAFNLPIPCNRGYIALYLAIIWAKEITSETALRLADGVSNAKYSNPITPEIMEEARRLLKNSNSTNLNSLVKKYNINKYEVIDRLAGEIFTDYIPDEGVITVMRINELMKKLQVYANQCNETNCNNCILNADIGEGESLCGLFSFMEFDDKGNPILPVKGMPKVPIKRYLQGKPEIKSFRVYPPVSEKLEKHLQRNRVISKQDLVNIAIVEHIAKIEHKEG